MTFQEIVTIVFLLKNIVSEKNYNETLHESHAFICVGTHLNRIMSQIVTKHPQRKIQESQETSYFTQFLLEG
jgi:hypothetical protein